MARNILKVKEKKVERIPDRSADRCLRELCDSDDETTDREVAWECPGIRLLFGVLCVYGFAEKRCGFDYDC